IGCGMAALIAVPLVVVFVLLPLFGIARLPGLLGGIGGFLDTEATLKREFNIEMRDLEGVDPAGYDPFGYYAQVRDFAGADAELVKIRLTGVRSDGTMGLMATYTP